MGKVCWTLQDYKFYTSIINIYRLGQWNAAEEEKIHFTSKARKDLSSFGIPKMYKCVVVPQQPFVFWNETKGSNQRSYQDERVILHLFLGGFDGYCIEMMGKIEKLLNFSCEYYQVSHYGQLEEERGTWSGMIRELVDGRSVLSTQLGQNDRENLRLFPP